MVKNDVDGTLMAGEIYTGVKKKHGNAIANSYLCICTVAEAFYVKLHFYFLLLEYKTK